MSEKENLNVNQAQKCLFKKSVIKKGKIVNDSGTKGHIPWNPVYMKSSDR